MKLESLKSSKKFTTIKKDSMLHIYGGGQTAGGTTLLKKTGELRPFNTANGHDVEYRMVDVYYYRSWDSDDGSCYYNEKHYSIVGN